MSDIKRRSIALVGTIDETELTLRVIEAMGGFARPQGATTAQVIAITPPDVFEGARRVARAALGYVAECLANGERPQ